MKRLTRRSIKLHLSDLLFALALQKGNANKMIINCHSYVRKKVLCYNDFSTDFQYTSNDIAQLVSPNNWHFNENSLELKVKPF